MAAAYHAEAIDHEATFDLYARELPPSRGFLVACGLEQALDYLETLRFDERALEYLDSLGLFDASFLERLVGLRFTGEVLAVPEGEVVFPPEPLLCVTAPLIEAQIAETFLLNCLSFQTMVASKAARVAIACGERSFVEFSARRDHGVDAALKAARAAFVGGARATSLVVAGLEWGLPLSGTMAHSFVMTYEDEEEAFRAFARCFPHDAVLLVDTYDTVVGARRAARVARETPIRAVRLDSGDLDQLSRQVRRVLDDAGLPEVEIFASSELDEHRIDALVAAGAPIDAFGVGTSLGTSADAPSLGTAYKLVEDATGPKIKLSSDKETLPGRKQVHRFADHDVIALEGEDVGGGRPLLEPAMRDGRRLAPPPPLAELRERRRAAVAALPAGVRGLRDPHGYEVRTSAGLEELARRLAQTRRAG